MALLCRLLQTLSSRLGVADKRYSPQEIFTLHNDVSAWLEECPAVYETTPEPGDSEPPYVDLQRWRLRVVAYTLMLQPLKPYLTTTTTLDPSTANYRLHAAAVQCALRLVEASCQMADSILPIAPNFHTSIYTTFYAAALMCAGLLHDRNGTLFHRVRVIASVRRAVCLMRQLSGVSSIAATVSIVLGQLIERLGLSDHDKTSIDRSPFTAPAKDMADVFDTPVAHTFSPPGALLPSLYSVEDAPIPPLSVSTNNVDLLSHTADFDMLKELDLGPMADIWNWNWLGSGV
ncbi:hypothetical protein BJX99DRAFT_255300 [Aspergillus californicus]